MPSRYKKYIYRKFRGHDVSSRKLSRYVECAIHTNGVHNVHFLRCGPVVNWNCENSDAGVQATFSLFSQKQCCRQRFAHDPPRILANKIADLADEYAATPYIAARDVCATAAARWLRMKLETECASVITVKTIATRLLRAPRGTRCGFDVSFWTEPFGNCKFGYYIDDRLMVPQFAIHVVHGTSYVPDKIGVLDRSAQLGDRIRRSLNFGELAPMHELCKRACVLLHMRAARIMENYAAKDAFDAKTVEQVHL